MTEYVNYTGGVVLHITTPHATLYESKEDGAVLVRYFLDLSFPYLVLGTLRSDESDVNENVIKPNMSDQQNYNSARALRFFVHFLYRHCTPTTWNFLVSRVVEDVKHKATIFFFFFWTQTQSFRINSTKISQQSLKKFETSATAVAVA